MEVKKQHIIYFLPPQLLFLNQQSKLEPHCLILSHFNSNYSSAALNHHQKAMILDQYSILSTKKIACAGIIKKKDQVVTLCVHDQKPSYISIDQGFCYLQWVGYVTWCSTEKVSHQQQIWKELLLKPRSMNRSTKTFKHKII